MRIYEPYVSMEDKTLEEYLIYIIRNSIYSSEILMHYAYISRESSVPFFVKTLAVIIKEADNWSDPSDKVIGQIYCYCDIISEFSHQFLSLPDTCIMVVP